MRTVDVKNGVLLVVVGSEADRLAELLKGDSVHVGHDLLGGISIACQF